MSPLPERRHPLHPLFAKKSKPAAKRVKAEEKPAPAKKTTEKTAKKSTKKAASK